MSSEAHFIDELRPWVPLVIVVSQFVFGWILWALQKSFVSTKCCKKCRDSITEKIDEISKNYKKNISSLTETIDNLDDRVAINEERLKSQPTQEQFATLNISMEKLSGEMNVLAERIDGMKDSQRALKELVIRVDTFLREQK
ncbi:DUF2730 family protein [Maridesulfovibrio hydrothermalis]|uniref:Uncharacterized protein n=1 Tax=Maridesulfovibrio hydrothermalis AM13 = DSM 14728 TaxID=1121451 RepID=L0R695_9BACT|nr:DUF2730 family protein [Maridesulfovibrio hydrothermalis]CCO22214.1 protein of unknown function [Maridesulfovibrio hydrothermalis AM13 = DSM 14728]